MVKSDKSQRDGARSEAANSPNYLIYAWTHKAYNGEREREREVSQPWQGVMQTDT